MATPVTAVLAGGLPVTLVDADGLPIGTGFTPATPTTPAIINGEAIATTYPGVSTGTKTGAEAEAHGVALQAYLDYCGTNNLGAYFPAGEYWYSASKVDNSRNVGLQFGVLNKRVRGDGASDSGTKFVQLASNHPVITIGTMAASSSSYTGDGDYRGFQVAYGATQTGQTSAAALLIGGHVKSTFDQITASQFTSAGSNKPYVGIQIGDNTTTFFFSCRIGTMSVNSAQVNLVRINSNGTGNRWENVYAGGGTFGNRTTLTGNAFYYAASGTEFGSIGQLNIEWISASSPFLRSDGISFVVDHLHMEGNQMTGSGPSMISAVGTSNIVIRSARFLDIWIATPAITGGTPTFLHAYDNGAINIGTIFASWQGSGVNAEAVASTAFSMAKDDGGVVGRWPSMEVGTGAISGNTGAFSFDATLGGAAPGSAGAVSRFKRYVYDRTRSYTEGAVIEMRNADLTIYAAHRRPKVNVTQAITADRKLIASNSMASSGIGNVATRLAGDIVSVVRSSAATGAFNINMRNSADDTTVFALAAASTEGSAMLDTTGAWDAS